VERKSVKKSEEERDAAMYEKKSFRKKKKKTKTFRTALSKYVYKTIGHFSLASNSPHTSSIKNFFLRSLSPLIRQTDTQRGRERDS